MEVYRVKPGKESEMLCKHSKPKLAPKGLSLLKAKEGWSYGEAVQEGLLVKMNSSEMMAKGVFISDETLRDIGYVFIGTKVLEDNDTKDEDKETKGEVEAG